MDEGKKKKKRIVMIIAGALLLVAAIIIFFIWRSKITATTMRILRLEGEVTLEDNGSPKQVKENLRLKSGNALTTAGESLVSIGLDDTKIVTLNEKSRAEFNQSGRKLDLELTAGSLFFEVSEPLTDEETFDIRTSTMVVGIRGTSGLVSVEGGNESLIISDGTVHVVGTNPYTGEVKEIDVSAGQKITVYLYNDREVDSIEFFLEEVTEHDLPEFALQYMRENEELLDKIVAETGWDKPWILMEVIEVPNASSDDGDDGGDNDDLGPSGETKIAEETDIPELPEEDELPETEEGKSSIEEQIERAIHAIVHVDTATGVLTLADGTQFDPAFYAASNPDVVAKYGTDPEALLAHWLAYGKKEGRPPMPPVVAKAEEPTNNDPNAGNSGGSSDEEEEEEPEPTPTAKPTGSGGTTGTWDSNSGDVTVNGVPIGHTMAGGTALAIDENNTTLALPLNLTDNNTSPPQTASFNSVKDLALSDSYADTFTVTGGGHTVRVDRPAATPVYELDGTNYPSLADLIAAINAL